LPVITLVRTGEHRGIVPQIGSVSSLLLVVGESELLVGYEHCPQLGSHDEFGKGDRSIAIIAKLKGAEKTQSDFISKKFI
jgi:hypothetical protein